MEFKVLSHACLLVKCGATSVVIDPWLLGSCYWRSWWNFPKPVFDEAELAAVDAVVISHIHWDHWHGPTLKKFFKGKQVIVPDEPSLRSEIDLNTIGFEDTKRLPHGASYILGDLTLTLYQFGRFLNDAVIVVEGGGVTLLNANDAKIAGWALSQIVKRHGPIDFAFRSHSSANSRICYQVTGEDNFVADDREHYFRSFVSFMDAVKPRYAIPFASNHCHLHDDVFDLNSYISNPLQLREYCASKVESLWDLQVMLPGSSWSSSAGFCLQAEDSFLHLEQSLIQYRQEVEPVLERYREQENAVQITERMMERFMAYFKAKGRPSSCTGMFKLILRWPDGRRAGYLCEVNTGNSSLSSHDSSPELGIPLLEMPAIVFRDAVVKNMFSHAGISKRCRYLALNKVDMNRLVSIVGFLGHCELGVFPVTRSYGLRLVKAYFRRWRELFVYAHALWLLRVRKMPMYLVEEAVLRGEY